MQTIALLLPLLLLVTPAKAHATNSLSFSEKTPYNAGFEQGYIGAPFIGHHTANFTTGYVSIEFYVSSSRRAIQHTVANNCVCYEQHAWGLIS